MKHGYGEMFWKSMILLLAGGIVGTVLLVLAYMLPVDSYNRDASYEILEKEGWYPRASVIAQSMDTYFHSFFPDVLDDSTDKIMLYTAMDTSGGGLLERAMNSHSDYMGNYSYYWHGYVSVLRPLMLLFDFSELRIFNGICQMVLLLLLAFIIGREKGIGYVFMLGTSYILLGLFTMPLSLQFTWVFYIAYIGTLVLLRTLEFFSIKSRHVYLFIGIGMLTSYFDLLTYPLFTWGVPLIWWIVLDDSEKKESDWVKRVISSGFGWIAGYAVMWAMKWGLATVVLGRNVFEEAINEALLRSGTQGGGIYGLQDRLKAVYFNWKHYEYKLYAWILAGWLLWWLYRCLVRGGGAKAQNVTPFF